MSCGKQISPDKTAIAYLLYDLPRTTLKGEEPIHALSVRCDEA
jgi:hypothetical protein